MKITHLKYRRRSFVTPALIAASLCIQPAMAGFTWIEQINTDYNVGDVDVFEVDKPNSAGGITTNFTSTVDGEVSTNSTATDPNKKIYFINENAIPAGQPIEFCFDFDVMLESRMGQGITRLASELRWFDAPSMSIDVELTGGNDTLANYFDYPNSATSGTDSSGNSIVVDNDGILRGTVLNTTFDGLTGSDTANYTAAATPGAGNFGVIGIVDDDRNSTDISFKKARYIITPDAEIAAGTQFQWTFGGIEAIVTPVPEPASVSLLGLGALSFLVRRKR